MALEWDNEYASDSSKIMNLTITYQPDGRYLIEVPCEIVIFFFLFNCASNSLKVDSRQCCIFQTEENGSPVFEVKATFVKDHCFRVEASGVINDVNVAAYTKVSAFLCIDDFGVYMD